MAFKQEQGKQLNATVAHGQTNAREATAGGKTVLVEEQAACAWRLPCCFRRRTWLTGGGTRRGTLAPASRRRVSGGRCVKEPKAASASTRQKGVTIKKDGRVGYGTLGRHTDPSVDVFRSIIVIGSWGGDVNTSSGTKKALS